MPLRSGMTELAGFPAWFHDINESDNSGVVCPDVMSFVGDGAVETNKADWIGLACVLNVSHYKCGVKIFLKCPSHPMTCENIDNACVASTEFK